jgi:hypothetical protein
MGWRMGTTMCGNHEIPGLVGHIWGWGRGK